MFHHLPYRGSLLTALALLAMLTASGTLAAEATPYASNWWREYGPDQWTVVLLHFGKPKDLPWEHLASKGLEKREEEKEEKDLMDQILNMDAEEAAIDNASDSGLVEDERAKAERERLAKPVEEPEVPTDKVYDYGDSRHVFELGPGMSAVPDGRFGGGLYFDGSGPGLDLSGRHDGKRISVAEASIRIEEYPEQTVCLISMGVDESKLLLHPDGRLELWRAKPHGTPAENMIERQDIVKEMEAYLESDPTVISSDAIPLGEWVHVAYGRGQTAVVNSFVAYLWINGEMVSTHQGCKWNWYDYMSGGPGGRGAYSMMIGNSASGDQPFVGWMDEVRVSSGQLDWGLAGRHFNQDVPQPWIAGSEERELRFDTPYFLQDGTVGHIGFDNGMGFDRHVAEGAAARWERQVAEPSLMRRPGVRGEAMVIDPRVARLRLPRTGMSLREGSIDFWARPLNFDDNRGLPLMRIIARLPGSKELEHQRIPLVTLRSKAPHTNEAGEPSFHPGAWTHFTLTWEKTGHGRDAKLEVLLYRNHDRGWRRGSRVRTIKLGDRGIEDRAPWDMEFVDFEFGTNPGTKGGDGLEATLLVDEITLYDYALNRHEAIQAYRRVKAELAPIELIAHSMHYRRSLGEISVELRPQFDDEVGDPAYAVVSARDAEGATIASDLRVPIEEVFRRQRRDRVPDGVAARAVLASGYELPPGKVEIDAALYAEDGTELASKTVTGMHYRPEPWYQNDIGVSLDAPAPWTAIAVEGDTVSTRMTSYRLGEDGLPTAIVADGENILAAPVTLSENGTVLHGGDYRFGARHPGRVEWSSTFTGTTCTVTVHCRLEFDGMLRYELDVEPTGDRIGALRLDIPISRRYAEYRGHQLAGKRKFSVAPASDQPFDSRTAAFAGVAHRLRRKKQEVPALEDWRGYAFFTQIDLTDHERGLYWFADNAAGWGQSREHPAQEIVSTDDARIIRCNLVAQDAERHQAPIVFGLLPHPARPLPEDYRYFGVTDSPQDERVRSITGSLFLPLPTSPKAGEGFMEIYPRDKDWSVAEQYGESLRSMTSGFRTMYTSIGYMKGRAGSYDNKDWRNMDGSRMSLTPSLVDYIMWEINEWVGRDIYDAFYIDDSYAFPIGGANAVKSGHAVRLPDGAIQAGLHLWSHRELMKRWHQVMLDHGKRPMLMAHHTGSWMYPGLVFATTTLDGEGSPTLTHRGADATFIDWFYRDRRHRFTVLQDPKLWGVRKYYMPSIWGFGPLAKGESPHGKWAWRMARSAQALFAHQETQTTFVDEGRGVFNAYWDSLERWGALDPAVEFVPFWQAEEALSVAGGHRDTWASFYRTDGKVLMIVSNLARQPRTAQIELDLAALGFSSPPRLVAWDAAFDPPDDTDPYELKRENRSADVDERMNEINNPGDGIDVLGMLEEKHDPKPDPYEVDPVSIDGNRLTVPLRWHDFRVFSLEE